MATRLKSEDGFSISWIVYASPAKVYEALTSKDIIEKWSGEKAEFNAQVNEPYSLFNNWVSGTITKLEKGIHICYTWKPTGWPKNATHSLVKFTFKNHAAGCEVLLVHTGFPNREEEQNHYDGWIANVFEPLNDYFTF